MKALKTDRSVKSALRRIVMLTTICALLLACAAFVTADFVISRQALEADLTTLAAVIGSNSAAALTFSDHETALVILSALRAKPSVVSASIYTSSGQRFAEYRVISTSLNPSTAPAPGARFLRRRLEVTRDIYFDGERIGRLYIASDLRDLVARMKSQGVVAGAILLASLLAALTLSSRLQTILTTPIRELATTADRVRHDRDYSLRATSHGHQTAQELELLTSAFNDMLAEIQTRDGELQRHRDDLESEVTARTTALRVSNGKLLAARDAAERIADRNERLSLHKHRILNTVAEGLFELDETGAVTFINRAAASMLGYDAEELIGKSLHAIIHADDGGQHSLEECTVCSAAPGQMMNAGRNVPFVTRTGTTFPVEFTTSAMPAESGAAGVVVTFRDITQQVIVERMKDEFVSTVSHELRTPLSSIRGALGLLDSGLIGEVPDRAHRMLEIALTNTDRLVRLINDILDLEKMSTGRVELNRKFVPASMLVRDAFDVIQNLADKAGVTLTSEVCETSLWVDPDRIVQTLTNLLGNAVKFSPPGTTVRLTGSAESGSFSFRISDQGRGIPPGKLESIFERFKQVDASDSRDKGGTGLGLAICRSIVTAHGGRIWAESQPGEGSTFHITVPRAASEVTTELPMAALARHSYLYPILLVEDDPDLTRVITALLAAENLVPICATTGVEAMSLCDAMIPGLMILDLGLPDMNGFAIIEWMRTSPVLSQIPLIVYSASDISAFDQQRLRLGPTVFLTKSRAPLNNLIRQVVSLLSSTLEAEVASAR
ncbi:MAG: ATP-binding protein [Acidobacteriota bacterium]|nr:ATP-binding protein [Acidobacteriota bacterium]